MPIYEYRCRRCGITIDSTVRANALRCRGCNGDALRCWRFRTTPVVHEHHDPVTGKVVSSRRQQAEELKRAAEEQERRTGIPHRYTLVDPSDIKALGVTDEGLDSTYNAAVREGRSVEKKKWRQL